MGNCSDDFRPAITPEPGCKDSKGHRWRNYTRNKKTDDYWGKIFINLERLF